MYNHFLRTWTLRSRRNIHTWMSSKSSVLLEPAIMHSKHHLIQSQTGNGRWWQPLCHQALQKGNCQFVHFAAWAQHHEAAQARKFGPAARSARECHLQEKGWNDLSMLCHHFGVCGWWGALRLHCWDWEVLREGFSNLFPPDDEWTLSHAY